MFELLSNHIAITYSVRLVYGVFMGKQNQPFTTMLACGESTLCTKVIVIMRFSKRRSVIGLIKLLIRQIPLKEVDTLICPMAIT